MRRACVMGWPVEHSRSPLIHRYWLKQYGIDGAYEKEAVPPGEVEAFLRGLGERGYVGANVTLPHKLAALKAADIADGAAYAISAANTLWLDQAGKLNATNTDAYGFMTNLEAQAPGWNAGRRPVLVIGAGGAARAILYGLLQAGAGKTLLANRTRDKAEVLAAYFGSMSPVANWVEVVEWGERDRAVAACGLLVNTTSLGMSGQPPLDLELHGTPGKRRGCRHRLHAARDAAPRRCAEPGADVGGWARHAAASGGAGLRALVRGAARGDA